ncbi:MAG TPA: hypothetical protein VHU13_03920 [Solirubrobacteraceae bacterium]|jgi:hypothetical protein|nr:hypothetical protein [Solirubrobacteraceae bacterium]
MPIKITLDNREVIEADIALADWDRAYQQAVSRGTMVQFESPDGSILSINPHRVNLVEATDHHPEQAIPA